MKYSLTMEKFSDRLAAAMKARGLNQSELARAVRTSQSAVNRWLNGALPRLRILWEVAAVLNVNREWLLEGNGRMERDPEAGKSTCTQEILDTCVQDEETEVSETAELYKKLDVKSLINVMRGSLALLEDQGGLKISLIYNLRAGADELMRKARNKEAISKAFTKYPKPRSKKSQPA